MPILRKRGMRDISSEELNKKMIDLRAELVRVKTMVHAGGSIENPSQIRDIKRTMARILTILNERASKENRNNEKN